MAILAIWIVFAMRLSSVMAIIGMAVLDARSLSASRAIWKQRGRNMVRAMGTEEIYIYVLPDNVNV